CRWLAKLGDNLGASCGQALASANVKWHAFPAPGIDFKLYCGEGLGLRILRDAVFVTVAAELTTHEVLFLDGWNRSQDLDFLITKRITIRTNRWLHGEIRQHLKQVVLDDVADCSSLVIEAAAALDSKVLCHRDLDALDKIAVPKGLHKSVG